MSDTKKLLVIIPSPGLGHLVPSIEFANTLLSRTNTFSIHILVIRSVFSTEPPTLTSSNPSLNFIQIPHVNPSSDLISTIPNSPEAFFSTYIELHKPYVKQAVENLILNFDFELVKLRFVIDMFCTSMIDVAKDFESDCYTFFTSSVAFLGLIHYISISAQSEFDEIVTVCKKSTVKVNGYANPVPISVMPDFFYTKDGRRVFGTHAKQILNETKGVIVNTFAKLEQFALESFANSDEFPPLYSIGPVLDLEGGNRVSEMKEAEKTRILKWLDEQEDESVVFLCFGSMGSFKVEQLNEIAAGLENSRIKFLWSVRKPPQEGKYGRPADVEDPRDILPEGFLERTEGRGMICGWAPQTKILAHKAVGGFVTHCGWNSILESIWFGVPTAAWPLYAEQQINAFYMVKELGISHELKMDYRRHQEELVSADVIENAIKLLMSSDGIGGDIRRRVLEISERSRVAVAEGGSSFECIGTLITKMLDE